MSTAAPLHQEKSGAGAPLLFLSCSTPCQAGADAPLPSPPSPIISEPSSAKPPPADANPGPSGLVPKGVALLTRFLAEFRVNRASAPSDHRQK